MDRPTIDNGRLYVPYDGPDAVLVEIGWTEHAGARPAKWIPAFLDWYDGTRVAFVPQVPDTPTHVYLRSGGIWTKVGKLTLLK